MQRRIFIRFSALSAAAMALPWVQGCKLGATNEAFAEPPFFSRLVDAKSISQIGRAYLQQVPAENSRHRLTSLLLRHNAAATSSNPDIIHSLFEKKSQQDFDKGKTVVVKGWILSVTEARQSALFSLSLAQ